MVDFDELLTSPLDDLPDRTSRWKIALAVAVVGAMGLASLVALRADDAPEPAPPAASETPTTTTVVAAAGEPGYPTARFSADLVFDPSAGGVIMHGGSGPSGTFTSGTWLWDPAEATWLELDLAEEPPPRVGQATAALGEEGGVVAHGGGPAFALATACQVGVCPRGFRGDTWLLDLENRRWEELQGPDSPGIRTGAAMAYDDGAEVAVLFGGVAPPGPDDPTTGVLLNDTWIFDPDTQAWRLVETPSAPSPRALHQLVYDPASGSILLWGGRADESTAPPADLWAYDVAAETWTEITVTGEAPAPRWLHRWLLEPVSERLVMIGGQWFDEGRLTSGHRLWSFDSTTSSWEQLGVEIESDASMVAADGTGGIVAYSDHGTLRWDGQSAEWDTVAEPER